MLSNISVSTIMTPSPHCMKLNDTLEVAQKILMTKSIHHIPVVDEEGYLHGIISMTDIAMAMDSMTVFDNDQAHAANARMFQSTLAKDIMADHVIRLEETDHLQMAADIFKENIIHSLPIVNTAGKVVGILTAHDLLMFLLCPECER